MVKVLHIINNLAPNGAETLLSYVAPAMKRRGVDAEIATIYKYDTRTGYERVVREGVKVHSLDFTRRYDFAIPGAIRRLARDGNYQVVHANLFPTLYWTALADPECKKMIVTEHGASNNRMEKGFLKPIERVVYGRYDSIVCVGNNVLKTVSAWLPSLVKRMTVINNGIEIGQFSTAPVADKRALGVPAEAPLCIMVARFYKPKDHKTVIDAAALVPDLHVLFAGVGDLMQDTQYYARDRGMDSRIHFLGYRSDIPSLLKASDIYVHSSDYEGIPLSVAEAMACGVPVVASDVDGINELVQNGVSGLLFKRGEAKDLAQKMVIVLGDPDQNAKLRAGGRARAQEYSLDNTVTKLIALYNS